jgi:hypothetical protein
MRNTYIYVKPMYSRNLYNIKDIYTYAMSILFKPNPKLNFRNLKKENLNPRNLKKENLNLSPKNPRK